MSSKGAQSAGCRGQFGKGRADAVAAAAKKKKTGRLVLTSISNRGLGLPGEGHQTEAQEQLVAHAVIKPILEAAPGKTAASSKKGGRKRRRKRGKGRRKQGGNSFPMHMYARMHTRARAAQRARRLVGLHYVLSINVAPL